MSCLKLQKTWSDCYSENDRTSWLEVIVSARMYIIRFPFLIRFSRMFLQTIYLRNTWTFITQNILRWTPASKTNFSKRISSKIIVKNGKTNLDYQIFRKTVADCPIYYGKGNSNITSIPKGNLINRKQLVRNTGLFPIHLIVAKISLIPPLLIN